VRAYHFDKDSGMNQYELAPVGSSVGGAIEGMTRGEGKGAVCWISANVSIHYAYWVPTRVGNASKWLHRGPLV
jgi:hypothetical protein